MRTPAILIMSWFQANECHSNGETFTNILTSNTGLILGNGSSNSDSVTFNQRLSAFISVSQGEVECIEAYQRDWILPGPLWFASTDFMIMLLS